MGRGSAAIKKVLVLVAVCETALPYRGHAKEVFILVKRKIIEINEEKCNGCSECIPNCPEGALQIIDGKARLVSDLFCDGLGACIGHCPQGAIEIIEREAEPYDERKVMAKIVPQGINVVKAHLLHLDEHGEKGFLKIALEYLEEKDIENPLNAGKKPAKMACGCPGTMERVIERKPMAGKDMASAKMDSELMQWPVQLSLVNPNAAYFDSAELLVSADCVPFAFPDFHRKLLKGKAVVIGCPKLDDIEAYTEKLTEIIKSNNLKGITLAHMEVPCCFGLKHAVEQAIEASGKKVKLTQKIVSVQGDFKGGA